VAADDATLFDRVVAASRLNETIAPFAVSRLLLRADVEPETLTPEGLVDALPQLEEGIAVYLEEDELEVAVRDLRALAAA
jgi:hypothetical protein